MTDHECYNLDGVPLLVKHRGEVVERALIYAHLLAVLDRQLDKPGEDETTEQDSIEDICDDDGGEIPESPTNKPAISSGMIAGTGEAVGRFRVFEVGP